MSIPMLKLPRRTLAVSLAFATILIAPQVLATHSWGGYHWARTANPFTIQLGDNLSSNWDPYLATTSSDWSASSVLDTVVVPGLGGRNCKPSVGRVEVCNSKYGKTGWLGIASVWASGTHITQGTVKLNDTYFTAPKYNTPAWKNLVTCQEVGHTLGLDHQDEAFDNANLGTCMDYTNLPTENQHPNAHDYQMLEELYAHLDATSTLTAAIPATAPANGVDHADPSSWGKEMRRAANGRASLYGKDLGDGNAVFTFVTWADGDGRDKDVH